MISKRTISICLTVISVILIVSLIVYYLYISPTSSGSQKARIINHCENVTTINHNGYDTSFDSLKDTIINNCKQFQDRIPRGPLFRGHEILKYGAYETIGRPLSQKDCEEIWNSFKQAFVGKDPWKVPPEAYDCLIQTVSEVYQEPTCNKRMFWSNTTEIVHAFTKRSSCLTLEDTLLGFLLDGVEVRWCGKKGSQDIFTTGCPDGPYQSFWIQASAAFAASACGDAFVMLNGSRDMSYDRSSTFASVEVKHFNSSILNNLTVLLVTKEGDARKDCKDDASLKDLQKDLQKQQNQPTLRYKCRIVTQSLIQRPVGTAIIGLWEERVLGLST